jgi:hypothetical protein
MMNASLVKMNFLSKEFSQPPKILLNALPIALAKLLTAKPNDWPRLCWLVPLLGAT